MEIKKIKLSKTGILEIDYSEKQIIGDKTTTVITHQEFAHEAHDDFRNKMALLIPYLVDLCEIVPSLSPDQYGTVELIRNNVSLSTFTVTGFTIGGSDEHEGIVLIGQRKLRGNKVLNLVTPFVKWEDEHQPYRHSFQMHELIKDVFSEAVKYMEGKAAPDAQQKLDLDEKVA